MSGTVGKRKGRGACCKDETKKKYKNNISQMILKKEEWEDVRLN